MDTKKYILLQKKDRVFVILVVIILNLVFFVKRQDYVMQIEVTDKSASQAQQIIETKRKAEQEEKDKKQVFLDTLDMETDTSIYKFVNNKISFNSGAYIPKPMVSISSKYVFDTKGNGLIREEANIELQKLAQSFFTEFGVPLSVVSSYRSYIYQKGIKDRGCPDNLCAKAGYSEHQTGLTVDIFSASTDITWFNSGTLLSYYAWMKEHASEYGFHNTYQKGLLVDGYDIEPWHWRYVGIDLAKYLQEHNITIAEFYSKKGNK